MQSMLIIKWKHVRIVLFLSKKNTSQPKGVLLVIQFTGLGNHFRFFWMWKVSRIFAFLKSNMFISWAEHEDRILYSWVGKHCNVLFFLLLQERHQASAHGLPCIPISRSKCHSWEGWTRRPYRKFGAVPKSSEGFETATTREARIRETRVLFFSLFFMWLMSFCQRREREPSRYFWGETPYFLC